MGGATGPVPVGYVAIIDCVLGLHAGDQPEPGQPADVLCGDELRVLDRARRGGAVLFIGILLIRRQGDRIRVITDRDEQRRRQREADRAQRDHDRRVRHVALRLLASLAEADDTVSGATLFLPDGTHQFIDAEVLRTGSRA